MPRYFFGENAGRPIRVGNNKYAFTILSFVGGTHQGVVAVPDAEVAAFLVVASKWVEEITEAEYNAALEKKKSNPRSLPSPDLSQRPPLRPGPALKGRGAVVVDGTSVKRPEPETLPSSISDAVDLGKADAVSSDVQSKPTTRRENHRQKRGTE